MKPEVQSTRPDSAARQALWTVAGCDAKRSKPSVIAKDSPKPKTRERLNARRVNGKRETYNTST